LRVEEWAGGPSSLFIDPSAQERYLGLDAAHSRAVVLIADGAHADGAYCSGVFVAPEWVITSAHCLAIPRRVVIASAGQGGGAQPTFAVTRTDRHPSRDVALLKVSPSSTSQGIEPIPVAAAGSGPGAPARVEMAGYGLTSSGPVRALHFLVEPIVGSDAATITVGGFGASGACQGDSGGPLLARARDGQPVVTGVLSMGSASCRDNDEYTRLDALADWVNGVVELRAIETDRAGTQACGGITAQGRCLDGTALWCSREKLVADICSQPGEQCGFDSRVGGFRCVDPNEDPCRGVDSLGTCRGGLALRCDGGTLHQLTCSSGSACRVNGQTGAPYCARPRR
jgi:hypothetical protein